jgi:hypothetical protein
MDVSARSIVVEFKGPFSWASSGGVPYIAETKIGQEESGVYLWTVQLDEGELMYYVGQTGRVFEKRMLEHFRQHMSGGYHLYEPEEFSQDRKVLLWPGRYGPDREPSVSLFIEHFPELASAIGDLARLYRFYLAPLECSKRLRERIEAAIADHLYAQPGIVGEFQDQGITYRPRWDSEEPIQAVIRCGDKLIGLPKSLQV